MGVQARYEEYLKPYCLRIFVSEVYEPVYHHACLYAGRGAVYCIEYTAAHGVKRGEDEIRTSDL